MPDISKINALAIGSVGKVDGLAKASILDIDGVAVPAGVAPPLDTYTGSVAAYSIRLLRTAYTGDIMRVRRASDNVEADVGFDGGELKLTSPISNTSDAQSYTDFADFVDHTGTPTNAFVRYWYDQSGNANDAVQSTAGNQPQIYNGTAVETEGSLPALTDNGSGGTLIMDVPALGTATNTLSIFSVVTPNPDRSILYNQGGYVASEGSGALSIYMGNFISGTAVTIAQRLQTYLLGSTDYGYINGTLNVSGDAGSLTVAGSAGIIGGQSANFRDLAAMQEIIFYLSDQSSNRTGIENNINGHFQIY